MLRCLTLAFIAGTFAGAAILPGNFAGYRRETAEAVQPDNRPLWDEYGLVAAERAEYSGPAGRMRVTAYQLRDTTGAFAAYQWQRPADAQSSETSARTRDGRIVQHANYLLVFEGERLHPEQYESLYQALPNRVQAAQPTLQNYLPAKGRVPNSERYVLGPVSLREFGAGLDPSLVAFHLSPEGQAARYRTSSGEVQVLVLSYPTPQMAIRKLRDYQQVEGAALHRSGPLIAFAPGAAGRRDVVDLLRSVSYEPRLSWNEWVPKDTPQDAAKMILAIVALVAGLIVASILFGVVFGGSKVLLRRFGYKVSDEELTTLHLSGE